MARCTAPSNGHRTASGAANCPACSSRSRGYGGYSSYTSPSYTSYGSSSRSTSTRGSSSGSSRPRWSKSSSSVYKFNHLLQFVKLLKLERQLNQILEMYFFVTHGEIVRKQQKN